jgi:hypothetical protein
LHFTGFLLAEFDRGHFPALRRIINGMQGGATNGATFGQSVVLDCGGRDFPQDGGRAARR